MEQMTPEERDKFISRHVDAILKAYQDFNSDISDLSDDERHQYVHNRVIRDMAVADAVNARVKRYVLLRKVAWPILAFVDVLCMAAFVGIALHESHDVLAFGIIASVLTASRIVNYFLTREAVDILRIRELQANREGNTAALLFLVNGIAMEKRNDAD